MKILRVIVKSGSIYLVTSTKEEMLYFNIRYELMYNGEKYYFFIEEYETDGAESIICKMKEDHAGKKIRNINYRDLTGKTLRRLSLEESHNAIIERL